MKSCALRNDPAQPPPLPLLLPLPALVLIIQERSEEIFSALRPPQAPHLPVLTQTESSRHPQTSRIKIGAPPKGSHP